MVMAVSSSQSVCSSYISPHVSHIRFWEMKSNISNIGNKSNHSKVRNKKKIMNVHVSSCKAKLLTCICLRQTSLHAGILVSREEKCDVIASANPQLICSSCIT
jgi:hypothetical protein